MNLILIIFLLTNCLSCDEETWEISRIQNTKLYSKINKSGKKPNKIEYFIDHQEGKSIKRNAKLENTNLKSVNLSNTANLKGYVRCLARSTKVFTAVPKNTWVYFDITHEANTKTEIQFRNFPFSEYIKVDLETNLIYHCTVKDFCSLMITNIEPYTATGKTCQNNNNEKDEKRELIFKFNKNQLIIFLIHAGSLVKLDTEYSINIKSIYFSCDREGDIPLSFYRMASDEDVLEKSFESLYLEGYYEVTFICYGCRADIDVYSVCDEKKYSRTLPLDSSNHFKKHKEIVGMEDIKISETRIRARITNLNMKYAFSLFIINEEPLNLKFQYFGNNSHVQNAVCDSLNYTIKENTVLVIEDCVNQHFCLKDYDVNMTQKPNEIECDMLKKDSYHVQIKNLNTSQEFIYIYYNEQILNINLEQLPQGKYSILIFSEFSRYEKVFSRDENEFSRNENKFTISRATTTASTPNEEINQTTKKAGSNNIYKSCRWLSHLISSLSISLFYLI